MMETQPGSRRSELSFGTSGDSSALTLLFQSAAIALGDDIGSAMIRTSAPDPQPPAWLVIRYILPASSSWIRLS